MILNEQSGEIEKQQNQAMKNILGISASKMRERLGLDTLQTRRDNALQVSRFYTSWQWRTQGQQSGSSSTSYIPLSG